MSHKSKYTFYNQNNQQLAGLLELPDTSARAYVLFAHCFTCTKDIAAAATISGRLAAQGFGVLRFDFSGLGHSEGDFANTNFSTNVADLVSAADSLAQTHQAPKLIVGHSLGGSAALVAASQIDSIQAVATIAAPSDPAHISHHFENEIATIETKGKAQVHLGGKPFTITHAFLQDVNSQRLLDIVAALHKPLVIFHSPTDDVVDIDHARKLFQAAKHPKSFISLADADHLIRGKENASYVANTLAAWATRYISAEPAPLPSRPTLNHGEILVQEAGANFSQHIYAEHHMIVADEPVALGGQDLGMSPFELLLSALGSCTVMTLRMYAQHKGLDFGRISVKLQLEKRDKSVHIIRDISVQGSVPDKDKLIHIANRCPVHRTIHSEITDEVRVHSEGE